MDYKELLDHYKIGYEIVKLIHQQGKTYKEIADQFNLSTKQIRYNYRIFLFKLYRFYINYLLNSIHIKKKTMIWKVINFYQDIAPSIAYLEKIYQEDLNLLRHGNPSILFGFYIDFPCFRELTKEEVLELENKIVIAREEQKKSFYNIGKEFKLTRGKANEIYDMYYHKKVIQALDIIRPTVDFPIEERVYNCSYRSHIRWKLIEREYPHLVQNLIN